MTSPSSLTATASLFAFNYRQRRIDVVVLFGQTPIHDDRCADPSATPGIEHGQRAAASQEQTLSRCVGPPLESSQVSRGPELTRSLVVYDEEDGDFVFTRAAKKAKTAPAEPENEEPQPAAAKPKKSASGRTTKATTKKRAAPPPVPEPAPPSLAAPPPQPSTRRSSRRSSQQPPAAPTQDEDEPQLVVQKTRPAARRTTRASLEKEKRLVKDISPKAQPPQPARRPGTPTPMEVDSESPQHNNSHSEGQKIALPFSDTPIINRNKDFRKKGGSSQRRSSLGMRGRRASSLIENGHSAIPHKEVDASEFYKHIEEGMLEPRRMRQLLTWCGERALSDKPPHGTKGSSAVLGGRFFAATGLPLG